MIELGGNIELVGFKEIETQELIVLKKIIGSYARKFSDNIKDYEKLSMHLKHIGPETSNKYEVKSMLLVKGKPINSEVTEINLFVAVAESLKKLEAQVMK
ncbi:TPA: hypothetical protein HA239_00525 [Candidatus Woesearchaeota archaeon]|nr:hypothetical protein QT06_C0001G1198 [archaeon GW2011_AR15]MBS3104332.1 hypothetical protein [Candidatus Woesearchaeota archaeon]HIH40884.1 hypothetical protein [Candidatus Woesearchaeota archaeon]